MKTTNLFIKTLNLYSYKKEFKNTNQRIRNIQIIPFAESQKASKTSYNDMTNTQRERIDTYIDSITSELAESTPISIDDWCNKNGMPVQGVIKLLNKHTLPVVRLGKFRGAYPEHLKKVLDQEFKKQFRTKTRSKAATNYDRFETQIQI